MRKEKREKTKPVQKHWLLNKYFSLNQSPVCDL